MKTDSKIVRTSRALRKSIIIFIGCIFFISVAGKAQSFKAGVATRVITPKPLLPVSGGVGPSHPVKEKKGELYARALVFEKGKTRVAIVSVDNLGWPSILGDRSRKLIKSIPPENILIGATHTHSAPDAYGFSQDSSWNSGNVKYLSWCVQQISEAVNEAVGKLEPVSLKIAVGAARGKIAFNYYAPQLYDPRLGVIQAIANTGKDKGTPVATLVNYAIHPEVLGPDRGILSPDLCGPLYHRIETKGGGTAIFMNSAQGGMVTADNRLPNGRQANNWKECIRIGNLLADNALRIVSDAPVQNNPDLYSASRNIQFPVTNPALRSVFQHSHLNYPVFHNKITTKLNLLNVGTAQVLTIPGEALPNIGYYVKRHMKTNQPFLFGLTNDAYGYILDKVDYRSFKRYDYISRTSLGEMTGEIYMNAVLQWLKTAPAAAIKR